MNHLHLRPLVAPVAALTASLSLAAPAQADSFFDFESGSVGSWLESTTGGSGSTGVETHNGSQMAFVQHLGSYTHSLSLDFAYAAGDTLSFDMHAVAVPNAYNTQARSGVKLSFLTPFNVSLGTVGLYNTTNPTALAAHEFAIDNVQHHYGDSMAGWATLAGIGGATAIAKVGVSFDTYAETILQAPSSASVWFDNVRVAAVPEPGQWALMLAGMLATAYTAGRRRRG